MGQRVLELENGFNLFRDVKERKESAVALRDISTLSELVSDFTNFSARRGLNIKDRLKDIFPESEDYAPILALSIFDHDFAQIIDYFQMYNTLMLINTKKGNAKRNDEILEKAEYFTSYENVRIGLTVSAYLATGDKKFLVPIQAENVQNLLQGMWKNKGSYNFGNVKTASSDQYFAIHQLIKNASRSIYRAREESPKPDSIDDNIEVTTSETDAHLVATVKDNGTGILNDKLPLIFGGYTEGETNVGLRVVKRILDLKSGHAEVVSTRNEKDTFKYNTKTNTTLKVGENQRHGTTFTLYFPK